MPTSQLENSSQSIVVDIENREREMLRHLRASSGFVPLARVQGDMDGDRILGSCHRLQSDIRYTVRCTAEAECRFCPDLEKFTVHRPSVEIVHGLQLEGSQDAYITSWVSRDQSIPELWVNWILEDEILEDARILLTSYDAHIRETYEEGLMDMHNTSENLDLIDNAQVGHCGCPVILVATARGLLTKEFCVQAQVRVALHSLKQNLRFTNFLVNLQGFFCNGSPHHGTELANISTFSKGPLFKGLTAPNNEAARRNEDFRTLRQQSRVESIWNWKLLPLKLGSFEDLVVEEASARHDMDVYRTESPTVFNVCGLQSRKSSTLNVPIKGRP